MTLPSESYAKHHIKVEMVDVSLWIRVFVIWLHAGNTFPSHITQQHLQVPDGINVTSKLKWRRPEKFGVMSHAETTLWLKKSIANHLSKCLISEVTKTNSSLLIHRVCAEILRGGISHFFLIIDRLMPIKGYSCIIGVLSRRVWVHTKDTQK